MAGLQAPLSTLRLAPRDALRMTRGHSGLLFLSCQRLSLFTLCRSPGPLAYVKFRFLSWPQRAELRQRHREGEEDPLGALGLVVNMIVLWNTLYINAALEQLAREGHQVTPEDVARLSPLVFEHINLLGRYAFSVPEAVTRGELRPLRNPAEVLGEVSSNLL